MQKPNPDPTQRVKNRRLSNRRKAKTSSQVACYRGSLGLGHDLAVSLLDVSESGARLVVRTELPVKQELELNFLGIWSTRPIKRLAEVVWCVATADGNWCIGARLEKDLSYADIQQLAQGL